MHNFIETLQTCRGKYIALCEGDDYWTDPLKLQKQVDYMEENGECSLCFHNVRDIFDDEREFFHIDKKSDCIFDENGEQRPLYLKDLLHGNFIATGSVLFRRDNMPKSLPDSILGAPMGDWLLFMLLAKTGYIWYLDEVMGVYRRHSAGLWSRLSALAVHENMCQATHLFMNDPVMADDADRDAFVDAFHYWIARTLYLSMVCSEKERMPPSVCALEMLRAYPDYVDEVFTLMIEMVANHNRIKNDAISKQINVYRESASYRFGKFVLGPLRWFHRLWCKDLGVLFGQFKSI
jgi:glycosyltransferase involved in cell wall biosynthesis